jgi:general secretion pathway protein G
MIWGSGDRVIEMETLRRIHAARIAALGARRRGAALNADVSQSSDHEITRSPDREITQSPDRSGFTIIELLVVMSIIVVLSTVAMVQYRNSVTRSKEAVLREDLFRMRDAIDQYYADKNQYPATLADLASSGYIREVPKDPFTNSAGTWQEVPADPDPNNPLASIGVYNVKSGSDQVALDGSQYSTW